MAGEPWGRKICGLPLGRRHLTMRTNENREEAARGRGARGLSWLALGLILGGCVAAWAAWRIAAPAAQFRRAMRHYDAGRWEDAAEALRGLSAEPGDVGEAARFNAGLSLYHGGEFAQAREAFESLATSDAPVVRTRSGYNAGNCAYRLGDMAGAGAAYRECMRDAARERARLAAGSPVARALAEVEQQAAYNLALAAGRAAMPRAAAHPRPPEGTSSPGGRSAEAGPGEETGRPTQGSSSQDGLTGQPDRAGRPTDTILREALSSDTGPVLPEHAVQGFREEKDW